MYYQDLNDYRWFENRYLFRVLFTLTIAIMVRGETGSNSFKRTIQYMLYAILFGEVVSYLLEILDFDAANKSEHARFATIVNKLFVDLVFMTFNCSVCYAMAMYLQMDKKLLLRLWYGSIGMTLIFLIFHTLLVHKFGRLNYVLYSAISIYTLKLLFEIRNKQQMLFDGNVASFITR
eukprot:184040_1